MQENIEMYGRGLASFEERLLQVSDDQWHAPTPCTEWDVHDLVNHVVGGTKMGIRMLGGEDGAEIQDELIENHQLGDDPVTEFREAATDIRMALAAPGAADRMVRLSPDEFSGSFLALSNLSDVLIHAWDLAVSIDADAQLPADLVAAVTGFYDDMEDTYREWGLLGDRIPVPEDADAQTRLLGRLGRFSPGP